MTRRNQLGMFVALMFLVLATRCATAGKAGTGKPLPPMVSYLTPEDEARTFLYEDGYHLELVLSDPVIREPVLTVFDANGRMFVAEMRSYMQDVDGSNQRATNGRVSVHWSSKHNGVYDKHAVFADNLVLPRMVLPMDGGVLINQTDSDEYWLYTDTKGDGVADKKVLIGGHGTRGGNMEHQPGGIIWDLDNWLYVAVESFRMRMKGNELIREPITHNSGQWGLCQDDYGKPYFVNAGYEVGPLNFEIPILYHDVNLLETMPPEWSMVWPAVGLADVQGGNIRFRTNDLTLNHFTSSCGPDVYRGDRLPSDLRGDLLFCEPVGRLVRRAKMDVSEGFTTLRNAYNQSEFIRSTDPNFRPVNLAEAPDGSIYLTDMYRGVIQEKDWVNSGSYLRGVVQKYGLDKNISRGRIWRLVNKNFKPNPEPHLAKETPAELVKNFNNMNGWWRDTAQRLLVLRQDKSVVPALMDMARTDNSHLARIHALWTLEGLDALTPEIIREKLKDSHPQVRVAAIRVSESLYQKNDHTLVQDICKMTNDPDAFVELQVILTADRLQWSNFQQFVSKATLNTKFSGVRKISEFVGPAPNAPPIAAAVVSAPRVPLPPAEPPLHTPEEQKILERGGEIYNQLCFACHAPNGKGTPYQGAGLGVTMAPPLSESHTVQGLEDDMLSVVLKGLSGPVNGKTYDAQMIPMESYDDTWIAAVTSYIRSNFGNHSAMITSTDVARVRDVIKAHTNVWTLDQLRATWPQPIADRRQWKLTASHNPGDLHYAIDGNSNTRYDTHTHQTPGMWIQIELPEETEICGVDLDSGGSGQDYLRGYKVQVSTNESVWGAPEATGNTKSARIQIMFPPVAGRFIRIIQTGSHPTFFWSIAELQVMKMLTPEELLQPSDLFPALDAISPAPNDPKQSIQSAAVQPAQPKPSPFSVQ